MNSRILEGDRRREEKLMNEIFVDARMQDWNATAEAIAFERRVLRILATPAGTTPDTDASEASEATQETAALLAA